MVDRFWRWLGAGVVAAGVSAAVIAGAGLAVADDGPASGADGQTSSESSNSTDTKQDSPTDPAGPSDDGAEESDSTDTGTTGPDEPDATNPDAEGDEQEIAEEPAESTEADAKSDSDTSAADRPATAVQPKRHYTRDDSDAAETEAAENEAAEKDKKDAVEPSTDPEAAVEQAVAVVDNAAAKSADETATPEVAAVAFASAAEVAAGATATAPPFSGLLNVIGTVVFTLYNLATAVIGGPPILPANSGVTVRSSTLHLDCGCNGQGVDVQADWYVPEPEEGQAAPDRLIYLQHGFLARGPWYSHTAAALAKQTNSIVVAPSITSNFLASDACWLGGPPMHEAMARLFNDGNTALADSALAAGYAGPIPDRVVLMGHSLGGNAVAGIAGFMTDPENGSIDRLAGVVLLDGVDLNGAMAESLMVVPDEIPIYQLAAPTYFWNNFSSGTNALLEARPNEFIGVTLVGGSHVDSMRGGNPLIQFGQELVAGFVRPENGDAAQILMIDWVNDMFAGVSHDPITDPFTIDTPSGQATAVPLPNSLTKDFPLNFLQGSLGDGLFVFEPACVQESVGACPAARAA